MCSVEEWSHAMVCTAHTLVNCVFDAKAISVRSAPPSTMTGGDSASKAPLAVVEAADTPMISVCVRDPQRIGVGGISPGNTMAIGGHSHAGTGGR